MGTQSPLLTHKLIDQTPHHHHLHHHHQGIIEINTQSLLSQLQAPHAQHRVMASHLTSLTPPAGHMLASTSDGGGQMNLQGSTSHSSMDTLAGHELQVASSIELTM